MIDKRKIQNDVPLIYTIICGCCGQKVKTIYKDKKWCGANCRQRGFQRRYKKEYGVWYSQSFIKKKENNDVQEPPGEAPDL